jgi:tetratricopeptide (TPR) repeat protein
MAAPMIQRVANGGSLSWEKNLHSGQLALARGIYNEAERFLLQAKEGAAQFGRADSAWADVHRALAKVYLATAEVEKAQEAAREAFDSDQTYWGTECDQVAEDCYLLGEAFRMQWDFDRARPWFERSLQFREQRYGTTHDTTLEVLARMLITYLQSGQTFGLDALHARAYQAFQATHPSGMWATYLKLHDVAKEYAAEGKQRELQELLQRAANLLKNQVGATHKEVASVLAIEAEVLKQSAQSLAAWKVSTRIAKVEKADNLSLFASDERMYKLPGPEVEKAVLQLLTYPICAFNAPAAVRNARWRIQPKQSPQDNVVAQLQYSDGPDSPTLAELRLTLRLQPRGPACSATYQWQLLNSSNMALAKLITAMTVREIDENLAIMKPAFDLPAGFRTAAFISPNGAPSASAQSSWPTPQQFNESVQNPPTSFSDATLRQSEAEVNPLGLPKPYSGAFATVYHMYRVEEEFAVKCFTTKVPDQQQRYAAISKTLSELNSPYFVSFEYQPEGISVGAERYPILKMDWARGDGLIAYIESNLHNRRNLQQITVHFLKMMIHLQNAGIAHGDLQHGNIIVQNNELKLVDYDGMFVPSLAGLHSNEVGHRNYQHPQRAANHYDARLDNFSAWVIYTSLICLSRAPQFWYLLEAGEECLLFRKDDFATPENSKAFRLLSAESDPDIKAAIRFFQDVVRQRPEDVPSVNEVFGATKT